MKIENQFIQPRPKRTNNNRQRINNRYISGKKRKSKIMNINFFVPLVSLIFVILMLITVLASDSAIFTIQSKQEKLAKLREHLATLKRQNGQRRNKILNNSGRDFLYEKMARRQGLKKRDEVIINVPDRKIFDKQADKLIENYERRQNFSYEKIKANIKLSRIAISVIFGIIILFIIFKFIATSPMFIKVPRYFENDESGEHDDFGNISAYQNHNEPQNFNANNRNQSIKNNANYYEAEEIYEAEPVEPEIPEGWDEAEMANLMKLKAEFGLE